MTTSIVVPVFALEKKVLDMACDSLRQLRENTPEPHEIIVVDNGGLVSGKRMEKLADKYIRLDPNQGFSGGTNVGLRLAEGESLAVSSADVFVGPGWLPPLLEAAMSNRGLASPYDADTEADARLKRRRQGFWGVIWVMPREVIDTIGILDEETFPMRVGDHDFAIRARKAGFWVDRVEGSFVEHRNPHSSKRYMDPAVMQAESDAMVARYGGRSFGRWRRLGER